MEASQTTHQNFSVYKNSKLKQNLRNATSSTKSQKKQSTQKKEDKNNPPPNFETILTNCKYSKMLNEMLSLNRSRKNLNLKLSCDKSLYDQMHLQTKFSMDTSDKSLNEILQLNLSENVNDTKELFYTKHYTITPILYRIIINMASPDLISNSSFDYCNQKVLIFNYTNIFDKETFEKDYLRPFFFTNISPILQDLSQTYVKEVGNQQADWLEEYLEKIYNNIFIVNYSNLVELFFKIQNLPNLIKTIKEVSLIVIDSPNLLINQAVGLQYESEIVNDETVNYKTTVAFNKKKRKSLNMDDKNLFQTINKLINNFQKEFNFNLIFTLYDFERAENLNYLKYKLADNNFVFDNRKKYFLIDIGDDKKNYFMFQLKNFQDRHKIFSLEPSNCYVNLNCNIFGYIIHIKKNEYKFIAFIKTTQVDQIREINVKTMYYENENRAFSNN